ncbi:MAG: hypothetical protein Q9227_007728 [Pyrenula ochraceoflavens]
MSPSSTYRSVHLVKRPEAEIVPGETFEIRENAVPGAEKLKDGEVLVENLYLSLDPAMRGWLRETRSYVPPVQIGERMRGLTLGRILSSKSSSFRPGTYVTSERAGWTELAILPAKQVQTLDIPQGGRLLDCLGVLDIGTPGITGLTAYFGLLHVARIKSGDLVVISGAAGATGSVAGQIAKAKGATVIGVCGSAEKCRWLTEELGFDGAVDYKSESFEKDFRAATKKGINVFFDNTGGPILTLALRRMTPHSVIVLCGAISQYNNDPNSSPSSSSSSPTGLDNALLSAISSRIRLEGFIVFDYKDKYAEARKELAQWVAEGKVKGRETVVKGGLASAERALMGLYRGQNVGKMVVEVKSEKEGEGRARL